MENLLAVLHVLGMSWVLALIFRNNLYIAISFLMAAICWQGVVIIQACFIEASIFKYILDVLNTIGCFIFAVIHFKKYVEE